MGDADRVLLGDVVVEEEDGGRRREKGLLNSCRQGSRSFPRRSSTALCWDWREVLLSCCLRVLSLDVNQQLRVLADT
jgi:hypothetical protein